MTAKPFALLLLASTAIAAPPKGAFKVISIKDAKQTTVIDDMYKQANLRGEVVIEFDGDNLTLGTWSVTKGTDATKTPGVLVTMCRAAVETTTKWTRDTFKLAMDLKAKGWADSHIVTTTKKNKDTTTDIWKSSGTCNFSLVQGSYKVTAAGDKLTISAPEATTLQLERTTAITDVDTKTVARDFAQ